MFRYKKVEMFYLMEICINTATFNYLLEEKTDTLAQREKVLYTMYGYLCVYIVIDPQIYMAIYS